MATRLEKLLTPPERHPFIDRRKTIFTGNQARVFSIRFTPNKEQLV
jgi:hypothetical protein